MITFKEFILLESAVGRHGEYVEDIAEKTMVNRIIKLLFNDRKEDEVYDEVYSFIESDLAKDLYDKYYPAFDELSAKHKEYRTNKSRAVLSKTTNKLLPKFGQEVTELFKKWKEAK